MKKKLCLILSLALALGSLAGCGSGSSNEGADGVPEIYVFNNCGGNMITNEAVTKEVEDEIVKQSGVRPVVIAAGTQADTEKLNVTLASGEKIDIFWGNWENYASDGIIVPINEYLEAEGQDIIKNFPEDTFTSLSDENGNIWGVPRDMAKAVYPTWIRKDWLDQYNLPMPTTLEELETALATFKEKDPAGNGETIPLYMDIAGMNYGFYAAFSGTGWGYWVDKSSGSDEVKIGQLNPGFKDTLAKAAEWYQKGYLNQENFAMNQTQIREQITRNRVGATICWYSNVTIPDESLRELHPEADYEIATWQGPAGKPESLQVAGSSGALVTKMCKDPAAAIRLLNWEMSSVDTYRLVTLGIEGKHYNLREGTRIVEPVDEVNGYAGTFNFAQGVLENAYFQWQYEDPATREEMNLHAKYLASDYLELDRGVKTLKFFCHFTDQEFVDGVMNYSDINRKLEEETMRFVTGARPIDEYDAFKQELEDMGVQAVNDIATRLWNAHHIDPETETEAE